jgi:outer membrane protein TolC
MSPRRYHPRGMVLASAVAMSLISGCASLDFEQSLAQANDETKEFSQGKLQLAQTADARNARLAAASKLLAQPLTQDAAVELALVNSPALQTLLAGGFADMSIAAQSGRLPNPIFSFSRTREGREIELERALSIGLLDLLTLPRRANMAQDRIKQRQLGLVSDVIEQVTMVRQAWVRAVAAEQTLIYAKQVLASAQASAELARRMQAVGNFSTLARARQQVFYADAATQLAVSENLTITNRENLVRLLGLDDAQATQLLLPARLPQLPKSLRETESVSRAAATSRIDVRIAQQELDASAAAQGLIRLSSFTDIEIAAHRETKIDKAAGSRAIARGAELEIRLPIFDWGDAQRSAMNAETLKLANRLDATMRAAGSHLRENYATYRTSYDIARHYRDEVLPLHKTIADENLLRYNGMLIGVFELLAESRSQINSVIAAINAEQQFWLADAALLASIAGKPTSSTMELPQTEKNGDGNAKH